MYELMKRCWQTDPSKRPNFQEICDNLQKLLPEQLSATKSSEFYPAEYDKTPNTNGL